MKKYNVMTNVGRAKYILSYHDGVSTHKDGSEFWGIVIFHNKKKLAARIKTMCAEGYIEGRE